MAKISGRIFLVQENRFQLVSEDEQDQLFILSHGASIDGADLKEWARSGQHVTVEYEPAPGLIAAVARRVTPARMAAR